MQNPPMPVASEKVWLEEALILVMTSLPSSWVRKIASQLYQKEYNKFLKHKSRFSPDEANSFAAIHLIHLIQLSIYLSIYLSIHPSIYLPYVDLCIDFNLQRLQSFFPSKQRKIVDQESSGIPGGQRPGCKGPSHGSSENSRRGPRRCCFVPGEKPDDDKGRPGLKLWLGSSGITIKNAESPLVLWQKTW